MIDVKALIEQEIQALKNIPINHFGHATMLISNHVHKLGGKLITSGMGKAGHIAHNIATTFSSTGTPAVFLHPAESQHGDLGVVQKNDIMLLISNSGETREIIELVYLANDLNGCKMEYIVITSNIESQLAKLADIVLYTGNPVEVCPLGLTPTTSTTVMTTIGDILITMMMDQIGFTAKDYAKRHHGGYLGEKSRDM